MTQASIKEEARTDEAWNNHFEEMSKYLAPKPEPTSQPVTGPPTGEFEAPEKKVAGSKKIKALQLLALRTVAHMKWDLQALNGICPQAMTYCILGVLIVNMSTVREDVLRSTELNKSMSSHLLFALILLNCWNLKMDVHNSFPKSMKKTPNQMMDLSPQAVYSMYILEKYVGDECLGKDLLMPTAECIGFLDENTDEPVHSWDKGVVISRDEALCQVCFELGSYYFYVSEIEKALSMFTKTKDLLEKLKDPQFCRVDKKRLHGYTVACNSLKPIVEAEPVNVGLYERAEASKRGDFRGIVEILLEDNVKLELSLIYRNSLQDEIYRHPGVDGKMLFKVSTCNIVRSVMEGRAVISHYTGELIDQPASNLQFLIKACEDVLRNCSLNQKMNLKCFLRYLCDSIPVENGFIGLLLDSTIQSYYADDELRDIAFILEDYNEFREDTFDDEFSFCEDASTDGELSRQLIVTCDPALVHSIVRKLMRSKSPAQLRNLSNKWFVPREVSQLLVSLQGELPVIAFILVAKAKHCMEIQLFDKSRSLLSAADATIKDVSYKSCKLIRYQSLVVDLEEFHETGEVPDTTSMQDMVKRCKTCITSLRLDSDMYPGGEVIKQCAAFLLNIRDWDYLRNLSNSDNPYLELSRLLSEACRELPNLKSARPPAKALWETVIPMFKNHTSNKRGGQRNESVPSLMPRGQFMDFVQSLKEPAVLSLVISCLVKLYGLVRTDLRIDIVADYTSLLPNALNNAADVNTAAVSDAVDIIVKHSLNMFPRQPSWLRTQADIYFANAQYTPALRYYLEAGVVASDFFTIPVPKSVYDDQIYKNMIRCCTHLQCHTQVAVLCQFLDDVDYTTAFKSLQEKVCYDAMDTYYDCIWDITVLEFLIHLHNKRGEIEQKQKALKAVAQPDLNNSNMETVLNAAAAVRKQKFLRAMAKQYL
ncbi:integrator complex subunit 8-like isoform X2 [Tubulanus polymorphus]